MSFIGFQAFSVSEFFVLCVLFTGEKDSLTRGASFAWPTDDLVDPSSRVFSWGASPLGDSAFDESSLGASPWVAASFAEESSTEAQQPSSSRVAPNGSFQPSVSLDGLVPSFMYLKRKSFS